MSRRPRALPILSGVFFFGVGLAVLIAEANRTSVDERTFIIAALVAVGAALIALARQRSSGR